MPYLPKAKAKRPAGVAGYTAFTRKKIKEQYASTNSPSPLLERKMKKVIADERSLRKKKK